MPVNELGFIAADSIRNAEACSIHYLWHFQMGLNPSIQNYMSQLITRSLGLNAYRAPKSKWKYDTTEAETNRWRFLLNSWQRQANRSATPVTQGKKKNGACSEDLWSVDSKLLESSELLMWIEKLVLMSSRERGAEEGMLARSLGPPTFS